MMRPREPHPLTAFCDPYGILLRRDAVAIGIDDKALARYVASRVLVRLRHGAYCRRDVWPAADDAERHRLLCRAVMRQYRDHVVLSHISACLMLGGPEYGAALQSAHLTHLRGTGRKNSRIVHHTGEHRVVDTTRRHGFWVTVPARAVLEVACTDGVEAGLVQANHFLRTGAMTADELQQHADRARTWPDSIGHHLLMLLADGRHESVGEVRTDLLIWRAGLPRPEPQYEVRHPNGALAARVDFAWPSLRLIVEFDGMAKYHRMRLEGESIEEMVLREKRREDLVRELTGWTVIRIVWADLDLPLHTAARIRNAMRLAAA